MNDASFRIISLTKFAWILLRTDLTHDAEDIPEHIIPALEDFDRFVTKEDITPKIVGFLPVLVQPVAQYDMVYMALKYFQCVRRQLNQASLAVACAEGGYHIAREILFIRCSEFADSSNIRFVSYEQSFSELHWKVFKRQWC